ncbi:glycosyltransferase family 1 protein [Methylobacter sp.]|uniref:glycosyltransferase family 4 protein n=1 Tax=Methylobacter sp. TaxID=2051955 RepID=UPI0011F896F9|nr:glycosyltransferase family 1 protein [Methylobacter sp.]TAK65313.1 MAG: glycosyltransferase family 1 protein [Methylobacter sp.]
MKILLIGNYAKDHQFSMQKFSACLEQGLLQQGHQVRILQPQAFFGRPFESTVTGIAKWLGYIDKYLLFPLSLRKSAHWADIIHICDHSNAIYVFYIKKYAHLVTCHDLMAVRSALGEFEENNQVGKTGQLQQQWILKGLQLAGHIASVSNATKQDVMRLAKQPSDNVTVIHNGLNYSFNPVAKEQALALLNRYGITQNMRFLLHVGGNQWYKNRRGLLAIFNRIIRQRPDTDLKLVMAGKPFTDELSRLIRQYDLQDKVVELTEPSTEDLGALYSLATAFIFPSLCEGFGWPIIEAQACNALVFTSNREPMTEVGGDAAIYIDPEIPDQAASIINNTLDNNDLINKTLNANPSNLLQFSTELMVERYLSLYKKIILKRN